MQGAAGRAGVLPGGCDRQVREGAGELWPPHYLRPLGHLCRCFLPCSALPAGGGLHDSHVVQGMVLKRGVEGSVARVADAKVAVFAQGVDTSSTETKVSRQALRVLQAL